MTLELAKLARVKPVHSNLARAVNPRRPVANAAARLPERGAPGPPLARQAAGPDALGGLLAASVRARAQHSATLMRRRRAPVAHTEDIGFEKQPADTTLPLPPDIAGSKKLGKGEMKWTLKAVNHSQGRVDVDFKPDATTVDAKTISFGQTVINRVGAGLAYAGGTAADPAKNKAKFEPFEETSSKKRMDHLVDSENDPFYGAEWDQDTTSWKQERSDWQIGSSSTKDGTSTSASMFDTPGTPWAREGHGDVSIEFETVPMVLETREPLGSLRWGYSIKDAANAPIKLTGGKDADCTDTPTADWGATMDKFYAAKYAEILDEFDIGKANLKPDHKKKLDNIVTTMKGKASLQAQLGGAADLTGNAEFNLKLSLKRAENARDYLVSKGIDAARLEVQSYGADWARVAAEPGKSQGKNRRVQIWLH